jgi:hypothetical protein
MELPNESRFLFEIVEILKRFTHVYYSEDFECWIGTLLMNGRIFDHVVIYSPSEEECVKELPSALEDWAFSCQYFCGDEALRHFCTPEIH